MKSKIHELKRLNFNCASKKLLLVLFCAFSFNAFSQASATQPADLYQCGNEVFDLTVQTPIILNGQPSPQFTVNYFESQASAEANTNAIGNPAFYISQPAAIVYARVDNTSDATYAITSFQVSWEVPFQVPDVPDVSACGSYSLVPTFGVSYTADEAGTIPVPSIIANSMIVYRHLDDFPCSIPSSFVVTVNPEAVALEMADITVCDSWIPPTLPSGQTFHTSPGGSIGTLIAPGTLITTTTTIYIFSQSGTTSNCTDESSFVVTVNSTPPTLQMPNVTICEGNDWITPALPAGYSFHSEPGGAPETLIPAGALISTSSQIYIFGQTETNPNCQSESMFTVTVIMTPIVDELPDVVVCDSYTLPALTVGNYYTSPWGAGAEIFAGDVITSSMTIYIFFVVDTCSDESSFTVTILNTPVTEPVANVSVCSSYVLPVPQNGGSYWTEPGGMGTELPHGSVITESMNIYLFLESGTMPNCTAETLFHVHVGNPQTLNDWHLTVCDSDGDDLVQFDLATKIPEITGGMQNLTVTFHETLADAEAGTNAISSPYYNTVPTPLSVYGRVQNAEGCFSVGSLNLDAEPCATITGVIRFDADENGCTTDDPPLANVQLAAGSTSQDGWLFAYTNEQGEYTFTDLVHGNYDIFVDSVPGTVVPQTQNVWVSGTNSYSADFCIVPAQPINDIVTHIWPLSDARPGFPVNYRLSIFNAGSTVQSGTVSFEYDDLALNFINALPAQSAGSAGQLAFNFAELQPGQNSTFTISFSVEVPPTVNAGYILSFEAIAVSTLTDITPADNMTSYVQTVVNSYDPNDKTVLQDALLNDDTQTYLRYIVRFQNTGTADAINVKITDQLDANLDWLTFRPVSASHNYSVQRSADGLVTFNLNNINLPDSTTNEPASHGFVTYEVKLKPALTVNDDIYNTANIFFDFNAPIVTNTVMTDLVALLGVGNNELDAFKMYPNPASGMVYIQTETAGGFAVSLFDVQGKKILESNGENELSIDVSTLHSGIYFVKVVSGNAVETKKLIVK